MVYFVADFLYVRFIFSVFLELLGRIKVKGGESIVFVFAIWEELWVLIEDISGMFGFSEGKDG